jgi:large subunit ribosomal protein L24
MKIKTNDTVLIITGKDRGKIAKVTKLIRDKNKIVAEKVNVRTKHVKKSAQGPGQIIKFEAPIDASNAMVVCPHCKKPTRVGYSVPAGGKKQRVCKKCKQALDSK